MPDLPIFFYSAIYHVMHLDVSDWKTEHLEKKKKQQRKKKKKKGQSKIKRPPNRLTYSELLSKDGPLAQG